MCRVALCFRGSGDMGKCGRVLRGVGEREEVAGGKWSSSFLPRRRRWTLIERRGGSSAFPLATAKVGIAMHGGIYFLLSVFPPQTGSEDSFS